MPGFRCKKATSAPGVQWSVRGSDVLPVNTIGGMGSSNVPPFGIQLVRKVPGWRPLGSCSEWARSVYLVRGYRRKVLGARLAGSGRPQAS